MATETLSQAGYLRVVSVDGKGYRHIDVRSCNRSEIETSCFRFIARIDLDVGLVACRIKEAETGLDFLK
jgi:hypothetical protein